MKFLIVSVLLFGLVAADVSHLHPHYDSHSGHAAFPQPKMFARILRNDYVNDAHGNYNFAYETENGISHNEAGAPDNSKRGQYSYVGDDGQTYTVMYWADENGFHAVGDHIPGSQNTRSAPPAPRAKIGDSIGSGYGYQKPTVKSGYNYPTPKTAYLPPVASKPKTAYLPPPPKPKTAYLPPKPSTDYLPPNF